MVHFPARHVWWHQRVSPSSQWSGHRTVNPFVRQAAFPWKIGWQCDRLLLFSLWVVKLLKKILDFLEGSWLFMAYGECFHIQQVSMLLVYLLEQQIFATMPSLWQSLDTPQEQIFSWSSWLGAPKNPWNMTNMTNILTVLTHQSHPPGTTVELVPSGHTSAFLEGLPRFVQTFVVLLRQGQVQPGSGEPWQ